MEIGDTVYYLQDFKFLHSEIFRIGLNLSSDFEKNDLSWELEAKYDYKDSMNVTRKESQLFTNQQQLLNSLTNS